MKQEHYAKTQTVEVGAPREWVVTAPIELPDSMVASGPRQLEPGTRLRYEHVRTEVYYEYDGSLTVARRFLVLDGSYAGERIDAHEWSDGDSHGGWLEPRVPFPQPGLQPVDGTWPPKPPSPWTATTQ